MKRAIVPTINNFGPIQAKEGEYIEEKVRRITENGELIEDGAPIIYTERKDGVNPAYDILYRDWETDRKSTRLNSSHITRSRMPSSA